MANSERRGRASLEELLGELVETFAEEAEEAMAGALVTAGGDVVADDEGRLANMEQPRETNGEYGETPGDDGSGGGGAVRRSSVG